MAGCVDADEALEVFTTESTSHDKKKSWIFQQAVQFVVTKSLSSLRYSLFKQHYSGCKKEDRSILQACHKHLVTKLESKVMNELEALYSEENISSLLDDFSGVLNSSKGDKSQTAWRPTGNPDKDISAHRVAVKLEAKVVMEKFLQELELEEQELHEGILLDEDELSKLEIIVDNQALKVEMVARSLQEG